MTDPIRIALFSTHRYDRTTFEAAATSAPEASEPAALALTYHEARLSHKTASLAANHDVVCCFVHDQVDAATIAELARLGVRLIALRSAGFNNVDLRAAEHHGIPVVRVPAYSPFAVAEHAMALVLCLNRKIHKAYNRVREHNFALDGLEGFDLHGKTFGIIGTGKIGEKMAYIVRGFGCRVIAYSKEQSPTLAAEGWLEYLDLSAVLEQSDILSLHVPLTPETRHLIDAAALARMKPGAMLINTGRGPLIDATALIQALKQGQIGAAGLDVYEEEEGIFFEDLSEQVLQDDTLARLLSFPNVLVTSHQAFLTQEALAKIATTTLNNIREYVAHGALPNQVSAEEVMRRC